MTADVTREPTGGQELREAVARWLADRDMNGSRQSWHEDADGLLALREVAALIADGERVRRVRAALDEVAAYAQEITDQLDMPEAEYSPALWRLHGDARGHRLAVSEIRRALDGEDRTPHDRLSAPGTRSERPAHLSTPATSERRSAGSTAVARGNHGETTEPEERQ